ncbi:response regulator [Tenuifilum thalassicum]|uniref:Response regulator n=1 Tax=Tenuifilum thalassicum TaxID=2590900 RepID=A0A7D3XGB6_9BACT|nr:response regulator [Tenuifilum thalassicum]QKG79957.1 response regulator [Tenuifilum thalassicum]
MNILLVDSSVQHLNRLVKALKMNSLSINVMVAMTASEAYEFLAMQSYDLIVSDINLPDESGVSLVRHVKSNYPGTKAIIYANTDKETLVFLKRQTGLKCFEKPTEFDKMIGFIFKTKAKN